VPESLPLHVLRRMVFPVAIGGVALSDAGSGTSASASVGGASAPSKVIPFQSGQPGATRVDGHVPADFTQGQARSSRDRRLTRRRLPPSRPPPEAPSTGACC
jgi:hypothetical protein